MHTKTVNFIITFLGILSLFTLIGLIVAAIVLLSMVNPWYPLVAIGIVVAAVLAAAFT